MVPERSSIYCLMFGSALRKPSLLKAWRVLKIRFDLGEREWSIPWRLASAPSPLLPADQVESVSSLRVNAHKMASIW